MARSKPRLHIAKSPTRLADGKVYRYAYVRYEVYDPATKRSQPKPLASLGRVDQLDEDRLATVGGFLREWLRKDSSLPFEALKEKLDATAPALRILCSKDFGMGVMNTLWSAGPERSMRLAMQAEHAAVVWPHALPSAHGHSAIVMLLSASSSARPALPRRSPSIRPTSRLP